MEGKNTNLKDNKGREVLVGDTLLDDWLVEEFDGQFFAIDKTNENLYHPLKDLLSTNLYYVISR